MRPITDSFFNAPPKARTGIAPKPAFDRFIKFVEISEKTTCWRWLGGKTIWGYGTFSLRSGKLIGAHQFSYLTFYGQIEPGLVIDHLCRNPSCVNPSHLEAVTQAENMRRGLLPTTYGQQHRIKTHCPKGHAYEGRNLILGRSRATPNRRCRECLRVGDVQRRRKKKNVAV